MRRAFQSRSQGIPWIGAFGAGFFVALLLCLTTGPRTGVQDKVGLAGRVCQRHTRTGVCVEEFFQAVDESYRHLWPGSVDLLLRSHMSEKFFLMETLFQSIDLMWPKGVGDVVLVLDKGEEKALGLIPTWVKVFFEENHLQLPGKILQQWSYGWADKYTSADFVAIIDDDIIFTMKVTPPLLFILTEGTPYIIGSARHQRKVWAQATNFLVGRDRYVANFMVHLPFVVPREAFKAFRENVARVQPPGRRDYDQAMKWFSLHAKKFGNDQIQHSALGNYLFHFMPDKVHIALEWTNHTPIPRVAAHIPWTMKFYAGTNFTDYSPKVTELYVSVAAHYAMEGLCASFPQEELPECEFTPASEAGQDQIWRYALDWNDWPGIFKKGSVDGRRLYNVHISQMRCMYQAYRELIRHSSTRDLMTKAMRHCLNH